jgi:hypothetical protein
VKSRLTVLALVLLTASMVTSSAGARWQPPVGTAWQWQLDKPLDVSVDVPVY